MTSARTGSLSLSVAVDAWVQTDDGQRAVIDGATGGLTDGDQSERDVRWR